MLKTCYCNMGSCNGRYRGCMVWSQTEQLQFETSFIFQPLPGKCLQFDTLKGRTSSIPTHLKCKPTATKIKPIISESLTPDKITSPDSVRAASLESTNRTEFFISSSSSSLQSGLLAPTAKATKLINSGAMFKIQSTFCSKDTCEVTINAIMEM